jgi:hypothetical protein
MDEVIASVIDKLSWMRQQQIWPNGRRYLWTDAYGVVLLASLYQVLLEEQYLVEAEWVVAEVNRVLGRPQGIRIGEASDREGQYFHYLAMWLYALYCLGQARPAYRKIAVDLVQQIHPAFVRPGAGVYWKMREDLSGPYPEYGFGALDAFHGYVVYRLLDSQALAGEIVQMQELVEANYESLIINQDLGLGMMLWFAHFFPHEPWADSQKSRSLATLDRMWVDPPGYFCRYLGIPKTKIAFSNYGVSLGLQAMGMWSERVKRLNDFFADYRSGDAYDLDAITHLMACTSYFPGEFLHRSL